MLTITGQEFKKRSAIYIRKIKEVNGAFLVANESFVDRSFIVIEPSYLKLLLEQTGLGSNIEKAKDIDLAISDISEKKALRYKENVLKRTS